TIRCARAPVARLQEVTPVGAVVKRATVRSRLLDTGRRGDKMQWATVTRPCLKANSSRQSPEVQVVVELKYLRALFFNEGKMEHDMDGDSGAASAVMQAFHQSNVEGVELEGGAMKWTVESPPPSPTQSLI
ncbi:unnamed protein product, partial [Pleuronectes platessa]